MAVIHLMCPLPARDRLDAATIGDEHLMQLKFMAEFAVGIVADDLDGNGAREGYFDLPQDQGEGLSFCCVDILRRVEDLLKRVPS